MQDGAARSVALALAQTAMGPSEMDFCLLAALSQVGTVCTWGVSGDAKVGIKGGEAEFCIFSNEFLKPK